MTYYIGLDAHSKASTAVVADQSGKILHKTQFPTTEKHLIDFIKAVKRPRFLAFEEMNLSQWLFVLLKEYVDDIAVAHAPHLQKQRSAKNDLIDAIRLSTELRCGTITRVFHEESNLWDLRALVNSYQDFTVDLTRSKVRYKSFLRSVRASIIAAVICSPERFSNKHKLWSYSMLVRHVEISDGKIYGSKKARGRSELKVVFMGAATAVLAGDSGLRKYYDQLRSAGVSDRDAKKSVARRIAAIALMIMKTQKTYDDKYEEKRRRPKSVVST